MNVLLLVFALFIGANASLNHHGQPQGGNNQISNILLRLDDSADLSLDDTPLYPPLTQPQIFRLLPACEYGINFDHQNVCYIYFFYKMKPMLKPLKAQLLGSKYLKLQ